MKAIVKTECYPDPYLVEIEGFLAWDTEALIRTCENASPAQDLRFFPTMQASLSNVAKRVHQSDGDYGQKIINEIKHQRQRLEHIQRGHALLNSHSSGEFETALYWYVEQGGDKELILLQQMQDEPVCDNEKARRLIKKAYERIGARIPKPQEFTRPSFSELEQVAPANLRDAFKQWINKLERINRRHDLRRPPTLDVFMNTIRWMAERGDLEDLDLLRKVRANPPFNSEAIQKLLETAEERIHDRVYDPQTVVDREEAAYQEHRREWDEAYAGEFIAIHRGQVIDHDTDKRRLIQRLDQKQRETGRFSAYIVQIGAPVYSMRGPAVGRRGTSAGG